MIDRVAKLLVQIVDQVRIDFNRNYFISTREQRFGERSFARSDFYNERGALAASGLGNAIQNGFSEKKVLAEAATH